MSVFKEELFKVFKRRSLLLFLIFTATAFPTMVAYVEYLDSVKGNIIEGLFLEKVAHFILTVMRGIPFMVIWGTVFTAQELSNGYVNKVVMATSHKHYFLSKVSFSVILALFFTILGFFSLYLSIVTISIDSIRLDWAFAIQFFIQLLLIALLYSLTFMNLSFALRSPLAAGLAALFFPQIDSIIFIIVKIWLNIELWYLPFQLLGSLFQQTNTEGAIREEYAYLLRLSPMTIIWPILFVATSTYLSYKWFSKRDLKTSSD
jgi:hypothetical protein